jgi:hypothetical protein
MHSNSSHNDITLIDMSLFLTWNGTLYLGRQGSSWLECWVCNPKVAGLNPWADKVQICRFPTEQVSHSFDLSMFLVWSGHELGGLSMFRLLCCVLRLAWYGSQSEAVVSCLWLRIILRQPFPTCVWWVFIFCLCVCHQTGLFSFRIILVVSFVLVFWVE